MLKKLEREEYMRRSAGADRVAVFREYVADRETPVAALSRLDDEEEAFLLESVAGGENRGGIPSWGWSHAGGARDRAR